MQVLADKPTLGFVLDELRRRELLDDPGMKRIDVHLAKRAAPAGEPWFVHALLAAGAWIAAICFIVCLAIADLLDDEPWVLFAWGAAFVAAATLLRNVTNRTFPAQLALAVSLAGHGFILAGAGFLTDTAAGVAAASLVVCMVLYPLYRDGLHRFLSSLLAAGCVTAWIMIEDVAGLIHVVILAKIIGVGLAFMYRTDLVWLRPLGYALALSVPADLFLVLLPEDVTATPWWPANVVLAAALVWLYQWVAGGWRRLKEEPLVVAVVATVCLAAFTTPGVLAALGLLVLGYARRDALLLAMGTAFFPAFIVVFYYEMQISLLTKSYILMGSGAVLLAARWFLNRRGWEKLEAI
jgi:hypothetical protein